jgi:hypothetical protein
LAPFTGLPFELVDFLQNLDGKQDIVVLEMEQRIRVVEQDVRIENVILGFRGFWGRFPARRSTGLGRMINSGESRSREGGNVINHRETMRREEGPDNKKWKQIYYS